MPFAQELAHRFSVGRKAVRPLWSVVLIVSAFAAGSPAQSEDGFLNWIVKSVTADEEGALIEASLSTPQEGDTLTQGQRISTGPGQQMVLTNGRDVVTLKPGTSVEIGDNDSTTDEPNLELTSGTVHVKAGKRTPGHTFSVETVYLVATVKGTQFDVSTSGEISAVSVTEGVVGVQATATRQGVDVLPGKTAIVDRLTTTLPELIDSPVGGAATIVGDESTETASSDMGVSGAGDIGTADTADGSGDSSGSGGSTGSSGSGTSGTDSGSSSSTDSTSGSTGGIGDAVGGAVSDTTGAVGGAVSDTTDAVGGAVSDATDAVGDAIGGSVGGAVSDVGGAVGGAVSDVGGAVGGVVGGLGGALGGGLGGKK